MKFYTKTLFFIYLFESTVCQIICNPSNIYIDDPLALTYLKGIFYQVYSTSPSVYGNPVLNFKPDKPNNALWAHATDDSGCCKLIYISTIPQTGGYHYSNYSTLPGCATPRNQEVMMKALVTNSIDLGLLGGLLGGLLNGLLNALLLDNLCVIMWVCSALRDGVHVYCKKPTVSSTQLTWIQGIGSSLNLTFVPVLQDHSYTTTSCIADY